jgi:hypothetical protein
MSKGGLANIHVEARVGILKGFLRLENGPGILGLTGILKFQFHVPTRIIIGLKASPPLAEGYNPVRQFFSPICGCLVRAQAVVCGKVLGGEKLASGC